MMGWRERMNMREAREREMNMSSEHAFPTLGGAKPAPAKPKPANTIWGNLDADDDDEVSLCSVCFASLAPARSLL